MLRRAILALLTLLVLTAAAAAAFYARMQRPFKGYIGAEQFVDIPPGSGIRVIERRLIEEGIVQSPVSFRMALWRTAAARRLQAGEYRFDRPMTAVEVVRKLEQGDVYQRLVTFPEGLTIREMATIYEEKGFGPASAFIAAAADASPISDLDPDARDLEGYLFPETYSLPRDTPPARLVRSMVDRFKEVFDAELRRAAGELGLTLRQAVTLASLVEEETALPDERAIVAAVYLNRLKRGIGLQCDPTVIYAVQRAGRFNGNLTREDLAFDSPYNTYKYAGLPPGPIAAPGRSSLAAAARPAKVDYLYFVSRNDGSHQFARTLEEHNHNVREFQIQYFRDKRAEGKKR